VGRRPKGAKLALNRALRVYVEEKLAGTVAAPNGAIVAGPMVSWSGRRHGHRKARRWSTAWSPEQIARRLAVDFPNDETMLISHEAIVLEFLKSEALHPADFTIREDGVVRLNPELARTVAGVVSRLPS